MEEGPIGLTVTVYGTVVEMVTVCVTVTVYPAAWVVVTVAVLVFPTVDVMVLVVAVAIREQAELILLAAKADNTGGKIYLSFLSTWSRLAYTVFVAAVTVLVLDPSILAMGYPFYPFSDTGCPEVNIHSYRVRVLSQSYRGSTSNHDIPKPIRVSQTDHEAKVGSRISRGKGTY